MATGLCRLRNDDLRPGIVVLRRVNVASGELFLAPTRARRILGCLPEVLGMCGPRRMVKCPRVVPALLASAPLQLGWLLTLGCMNIRFGSGRGRTGARRLFVPRRPLLATLRPHLRPLRPAPLSSASVLTLLSALKRYMNT